MEQEDFLRLFLQHQPDLRAFIGSAIRDRHAADDVLQETALALWQGFEKYDRTRPFGAWARGVATNKVLQRWAKNKRSPMQMSPEALEAVRAAYDEAVAPSLPALDALQLCVQGLSERKQKLLTLRYGEGMGLPSIADKIAASLDAVHKALCRIRSALHECVERRLGTAKG